MRKSLGAAVLVAAGVLVSFRSTYEPDLWWHLAQGRETAAGRLVRANRFSIDYPDYPQPYTSWLFDLGSYALWSGAGPAAIQTLEAALIAGTLAMMAAACRQRSSLGATIAVCAFGWIVLEPRALPRPHLISFFGLAACMLAIESARRGRSWRPLLWCPAAIAVWSNFHVECVFGVAALALFAGGELVRPRDLSREDAAKAIVVTVAALLATAANPYGFGLLRYTYENSFVPQLIDVAELRPPYLPNYRGFFAWAILAAVLAVVRRTCVSLSDALLITLFGALGFRYLRLTPLLILASAPLVGRCLDDLRWFRAAPRLAPAVGVLAALLLVRVPLPTLVRDLRAGGDALEPPALFSPRAMAFARTNGLSGPVFTSINLGGYVAWHLYPAAHIFLDSRLQAYPPSHFRSVIEASGDRRAWAALTARVDWAVLSRPRANALSGVGEFDPAEWGVAFHDDAIEIIVRRSGRFGAIAAR